MFLGFTNFYKRFISNFNQIAILLTVIYQTTENSSFSTKVNDSRQVQQRQGGSTGSISGNKNLSSATKLKKSAKSLDFAMTITFGTDFLTLKTKKAFIHL